MDIYIGINDIYSYISLFRYHIHNFDFIGTKYVHYFLL